MARGGECNKYRRCTIMKYLDIIPAMPPDRLGERTRAVMIPGLESAPEYDRSMILKFVRCDSGSGSFQVDPLESAPVLVDPIVGAF